MLILNDYPLYFLGDHHGSYESVSDIIKQFDIKDCYIIHVGDGGEGFLPRDKQLRQFDYWNKIFNKRNIFYKSIRGNHSDPSYFNAENKIDLTNFQLLEDYSLLQHRGRTIQGVGGAVSIDRVDRKIGTSFWESEPVSFIETKCAQVDVLVTHSAPSWCFPQQINDYVRYWISRDNLLHQDLIKERETLNKIFNKCQPTWHLYGHFHFAHIEKISKCTHKLLNINELWELR